MISTDKKYTYQLFWEPTIEKKLSQAYWYQKQHQHHLMQENLIIWHFTWSHALKK